MSLHEIIQRIVALFISALSYDRQDLLDFWIDAKHTLIFLYDFDTIEIDSKTVLSPDKEKFNRLECLQEGSSA